jgi:hypothetical protein
MLPPHRRRLGALAATIVAVGLIAAVTGTARSQPQTEPPSFSKNQLFIEVNSTDGPGDAGLQLILDASVAWHNVKIIDPNGRTIADFTEHFPATGGQTHGLTGVTFESAEPKFDVLPLAKFKQRFPAGIYTFQGTAVDGTRFTGSTRLSHAIPDGPKTKRPTEGAKVKRGTPLVVAWAAVRNVEVATYQVIVTDTRSGRTFDAILANNKRSVTVPDEFLSATGEYELEVLAKAKVKGGTGNQTITGSTFQVTA